MITITRYTAQYNTEHYEATAVFLLYVFFAENRQ